MLQEGDDGDVGDPGDLGLGVGDEMPYGDPGDSDADDFGGLSDGQDASQQPVGGEPVPGGEDLSDDAGNMADDAEGIRDDAADQRDARDRSDEALPTVPLHVEPARAEHGAPPTPGGGEQQVAQAEAQDDAALAEAEVDDLLGEGVQAGEGDEERVSEDEEDEDRVVGDDEEDEERVVEVEDDERAASGDGVGGSDDEAEPRRPQAKQSKKARQAEDRQRIAEDVSRLLAQMESATDLDLRDVRAGLPALRKLRMLPEVRALDRRGVFRASFLVLLKLQTLPERARWPLVSATQLRARLPARMRCSVRTA